MTTEIVPAAKHYHMKEGWLETYWHFSFDQYYDPKNMGFGALRVFNDDTVQPGGGWGLHPHRDMEIVTYVVQGAIEHRDSTGGGGVVKAGWVQRMSAGTGVMHSEFNPSPKEPLRLLQVWILPAEKGVEPTYETKQFKEDARKGRLLPIVAGSPPPGAAGIGQDVTFYASTLGKGDGVEHAVEKGEKAYLFVISGHLALDGKPLGPRDVARVTGPQDLRAVGDGAADLLLIDLP